MLGIAAAYRYAAADPARYADFIEADGSLTGPGLTASEAAGLPERYRVPGIVVTTEAWARLEDVLHSSASPEEKRAVIARMAWTTFSTALRCGNSR